MKTIASCKNLNEFQAAIKDIPPPVLGKGGGRKFLVQGKEVSMNTLVHKYFTLLKKAPVSQESHDAAVAIVDKLDDLNHLKLTNLSPKQEKRLAFRQKWGNFFAKVKYGPAFTHKQLRTDALKIYARNYYQVAEAILLKSIRILSGATTTTRFLTGSNVIFPSKAKGITSTNNLFSIHHQLVENEKNLPKKKLLSGFLDQAKTREITTPMVQQLQKKHKEIKNVKEIKP